MSRPLHFDQITRRVAVVAVWLAMVPVAASAQVGNVEGTHGDVIVEGEACCPGAGVVLRPKLDRPSVVARTATSDGRSGFSVFNADNAELLRVQGNGVITVGGATASPWHPIVVPTIEHIDTSISFGDATDLHVTSNAYYPGGLWWLYRTTKPAANYHMWNGRHYWRVAPQGAVDTAISWNWAMIIGESGNVGIGTGTWAPEARFHVNGGATAMQIIPANAGGFGVTVEDLLPTEAVGGGAVLKLAGNSTIRVAGMQIGDQAMARINTPGQTLHINNTAAEDVVIGHPTHTTRLRVDGKGTSTFGGAVSVAGNIEAAGTITATTIRAENISGTKVLGAVYQDLAEWVPSESDLQPGTVVVLHRGRTNAVTAATRAYDTTVAGVVSEQPGIILGEGSPTKEMIATTGRVKVRVDASTHPIAIGDLLVSSDKPGTAMKSIPVEIAGIAMHRPGTLIGKALEPLAGGEGEILVLLSMQ